MTVPDFQSLMTPVLRRLADGKVVAIGTLRDGVSDDLGLTDDERRETIPSGMRLVSNRVQWSVTYLCQAGAVHRPQRGHVRITDRGLALLATGDEVRNASLRQFPEFRAFEERSRRKQATGVEAQTVPADDEESPDDLLARAESDARAVLSEELLDKVRSIDPTAFERLVIRLLGAMGYGGSNIEPIHTGGSGDGGIDGIISEDKLGLDRIYLQAKRYKAANAVQASEVRNFLGALMGKGERGVFLTTSRFTAGARSAIAGVPARVVLIDGDELVDLMIDHGVGVEAVRVATLHRLNEDFFEAL